MPPSDPDVLKAGVVTLLILIPLMIYIAKQSRG